MNNLTEQQQKAVTSTDTNVLVSAGAGSGKTHVLVERYLETLRQKPNLTVANIIAVTYTKKAAGEMRSRLKSRLEELVHQTIDADMAKRWLVCRQEIDRARIGTIHSLCESILRAFPTDAEIDPQFELMDELEASNLLNESIDEAFLQLLQEQKEQDLFLGFPVEDIKSWMMQILKSVSQFDEARSVLPAFTDECLSHHARMLITRLQKQAVMEVKAHKLWDEVLTFLKSHPVIEAQNKLGDLCRIVIMNMDCVNQFQLNDTVHMADAWKALCGIVEVKLNAGGNSPEAKEIKQSLKTLRELVDMHKSEIPDELNEQDQIAFSRIRSLMFIQECVRKAYEQKKRQKQKLDFNDLIQITYDLLSKRASPAKAYFNENMAAILVDEFQDTNKLQSKLLAMLAGPNTRLFLIGDDKQSIYKFQGADVSTFNEWKKYLHQESNNVQKIDDNYFLHGPSRVETLNKSFRSHKQIVTFVNYVSSKVLSGNASNPSYVAIHQSLEVARVDETDDKRVECIVFDARNEDGERSLDAVRNLETKSVAAWIKELIEQELTIYDKEAGHFHNVGYGDFAVLVQRNTDIAILENAFAETNIPYVTMGGAGFLQKQEVYDLENMLKFLSSTQDSQALLGVLRSPMFAFSDDLLHSLAIDSNTSLWDTIKQASGKSDNQIILAAVMMIENFLRLSSRVALTDIIRTIITSTNYDTVLMSLPNGKQRCRNLWKFMALTNEKRDLSLLEFLQWIDSMRKLGSKISSAPIDSGNSVKLMTIHSSKGLEFPVVALPLMGIDAFNKTERFLFHSEYGIAFDTTRSDKDEKPAFFRAARMLEKDMAIAEKKRLLYVAMTRARDYLGMFVENDVRGSQSFSVWLQETILNGPHTYSSMHADQIKIKNIDLKSLPIILSTINQKPDYRKVNPDTFCSRLDLLGELKAENREPAPAWQQLIRKTPKAKDDQLQSTVIGNYFHLLMEQLSQHLHKPDDHLMHQLAKSIGVYHPKLREHLIEEAKTLLDIFLLSELYSLMSKCNLRISEPPYMTLKQDGELANKRPDLLLQDNNNKLYVIDFKTDTFELQELSKQASHHMKQLSAYVSDIAELTGITPEAAIYFARQGILHFVGETAENKL